MCIPGTSASSASSKRFKAISQASFETTESHGSVLIGCQVKGTNAPGGLQHGSLRYGSLHYINWDLEQGQGPKGKNHVKNSPEPPNRGPPPIYRHYFVDALVLTSG